MENDDQNTVESPQNLMGYILIWIGQSISLLGSGVVQFAIIWWLTLETNSSFILALATFVGLVPIVIIGPFSGVFADRWNRKRIIMGADFLQAFATFGLILLFWLNIIEIWHVLALLAVRGVFQAFQFPALTAIVPQMVPKNKIGRINALNSVFNNLIFIVSPAIGAILLEFFTVGGILWIDVISFFAAVFTITFVAIPAVVKKIGAEIEKTSFKSQLTEGFSYLKTNGYLTLIFGFTIANILINPLFSLLPLFIKEVHLGGAFELALLIGIFQLGNFSGSFTMLLKNFAPRVRSIMIAVFAAFFGMVIIALAPTGNLITLGMGAAIVGFSVGLIDILAISILQIHIPVELQGRTMSVVFTLVKSILPIALLIVGGIAEFIELTTLYLIFPLLGIILAGYLVFIANVNKLDARLTLDKTPQVQ